MPIVQLPGGSLRDEQRQPLYDTIDKNADNPVLANGSEDFFSNVLGKDITLTNLKQPKSLETAVSFRIMGLCLDVQNIYDANIAVVPLVLENSGLQLTVGEKIYWQGPTRFAAGRMWTDLAASGNDATQIYQQHGFSAVAPVIFQGKHVIDINPLQSFFVTWVTSGLTAAELALATVAADTKVRYVCSLKGIRRRPVQ